MSEKVEKFIILPPGLQTIAALTNFDPEADDSESPWQMGGMHYTQDDENIVCVATNGKVAGIYKARRNHRHAINRFVEELGRFPNLSAAIPTEPPLATAYISPKMLIDVLQACQSVAGLSGSVIMELRGPERPIVFRAANSYRGREFIGLAMPLTTSSQKEETCSA